jgi:hypothetical protein
MKSFSSIVMALVVGTSLSLAVGCAAPTEGEQSADVPASNADDGSNDVVSSERQSQLNALRARVNQDFAGAASLRGSKLVFVVRRLNANAEKAVIFARILKRDAAGKDSELAEADFKGSAYEADINDGLFDGPEITAVLAKSNGKWGIMSKGTGKDALEAYVVGPTDVAYTNWDTEYGVPRAWLGL